MDDAVVTVVTRSHFGTARALFGSAAARDGRFDRYVCVADGPDPGGVPAGVGVLRPEQFGIPDLRRFLFQYGPLELVCALKAYCLDYLHSRGYKKILYLDSDIYIAGSLSPIFDRLDSASVLLTPHLASPLPDDGKEPDTRSYLRAGVYNAGFVGVSDAPAARAFVKWWCSKTLHDCVDCPDDYVYVDQRWLDFVPGLFDRVAVVRDPGVNAAYWNLPDRRLSRSPDGEWAIDGSPLRFFHFSGFRPEYPNVLSQYDARYNPVADPMLADLIGDYVRHLGSGDYQIRPDVPYGYARLDSGELIKPLWREGIRVGHPILDGVADPFSTKAHPDLLDRFAAVERRSATDPLLRRFHLPATEKRRLDSLRRSILFGPLLALYRRVGLFK